MKGFWLLLFLVPTLVWTANPAPVEGSNGMVSSRSMIASQVGVEIMKMGGNAIDAAVATGFALAVTYPSAGNLGGGGFMVIRLADGTVLSLDFRETAPAAANRDMYLDDQKNVVKDLSTLSHKAIGVPGSVDGLLAALEKYGSLDRRKILAPAIKLAREGFPLSADLARQFKGRHRFMKKHPASMAVFSKAGEAYKAGDLWRQPDLAATLERIAQQGRDGFYKGKTADLIVAEMERAQGLISHKDLANYRSVWRDPLKGQYKGHTIWSMPPPSSGGVLLIQMLNMLQPYDLKEMGWGSAAAIHLMVEAQKRAYADRASHLGDPDFYEVPLTKLTDPDYARKRFADVSLDKASPSEAIGAGQFTESMETTHYSVVDGKGNAVACTTTLNWGYGSQIVVTGAGFLLNNEMDDFSVKPGEPNTYNLLGGVANEIQPGKRMLSSMTPTIVTKDGELLLVTGSPGGSTIINTVLQVIINVVDHEMSVEDAVGIGRFHHQWFPDQVRYERFAISPDTLAILTQKGHRDLREISYQMGDANTILIEKGKILGMSDPRNQGGSAGF